MICQECEEEASTKYCPSCEQYLCGDCSDRIHNKAKRARHQIQKVSIDDLVGIRTCVLICKDITVEKPERLGEILNGISGMDGTGNF